MKKGIENPKNDRTLEIAKILNVSINSIKKYDYKEPIDIIYTLMWLEEWSLMRNKKAKREPSYENYIE